MTKEQCDNFMIFFKEKNPVLFERLEGIVVFTKVNQSDIDDLALLFWPLNNKPYIIKEEQAEFFRIMTDYRKQNKIYGKVPSIEDNFAEFVLSRNQIIYSKIEEFKIEFVDDEYSLILDKNYLSLLEMRFLDEIWIEFRDNLHFY